MSPIYNIAGSGTANVSRWSPDFAPGPEWSSFEKFRLSGGTALDAITNGRVATLQVKSNKFRILKDDDFQRLLGLATEVHRLKRGITIVVQAAKIVAKHPEDQDGIQLLFQSASLLGESNILPECDGHEAFQITPEEATEYRGSDLEGIRASDIPRPRL
jgi:hypothetical protein